HHTTTASNKHKLSERCRSKPAATTGLGRNTNSGPQAGLCLDNRLLAMDWHHLPVGAGLLGRPPTTKRSLGRRPLGVASRRLGMDSRPLNTWRLFFTNPGSWRKLAAQRLLRQIR